jgi:hypothetical protein
MESIEHARVGYAFNMGTHGRSGPWTLVTDGAALIWPGPAGRRGGRG